MMLRLHTCMVGYWMQRRRSHSPMPQSMYGRHQLMVRLLVSYSKIRVLRNLGLYEQQDDAQDDCNLRGKFVTDENGEYAFYCLRPTPYPIPYDGPAGKLLQLLDRHPYRPAHIHLIVSQSATIANLHTLTDIAGFD